MEWVQVIVIVGSNILMFLWVRGEANADRHSMLQMIDSIQKEIKDFHGRLCSIEERRKQ